MLFRNGNFSAFCGKMFDTALRTMITDLEICEEDDDDAGQVMVNAWRQELTRHEKPTFPTSSILFNVKPWGDDTDMDGMVKAIKAIKMDGLVWGASKLVPIGIGHVKKLTIMCTVENPKVSIDELLKKIADIEEYVQSCDVAARKKT